MPQTDDADPIPRACLSPWIGTPNRVDCDYEGAGHPLAGRPDLGRAFYPAGDEAVSGHRGHGSDAAGPGEVAALEHVSILVPRRCRELHRIPNADPGARSGDADRRNGVGLLETAALIASASSDHRGDPGSSHPSA